MKYPSTTYRVQLNKDFTFAHLKNILPYLRELGVTAIYASPITLACAGSMHGYDVTDPHVINPEIGTLEELEGIAAELKEYNMLWIQDIVPNHMAFHESNWRLYDLWQRGNKSPYYTFFDINWVEIPGKEGKLVIPVLTEDIHAVINRNELGLQWNDKGLQLVYHEKHYPLAMHSYELVLTPCFPALLSYVQELAGHAKGMYCDWEAAQRSFIQQVNAEKQLTIMIRERIEQINQCKQLLNDIVAMQHYKLVKWDQSNAKINYRRFFAVNELISLQMDRQEVFDEYHRFIAQLYKEGLVQGIRIDHIDGLYNPRQYVQRLRALLGNDCYIIAEKILADNEDIGGNWDMQGTSGYDFLACSNQLFTNKAGADVLKEFYGKTIVAPVHYDDLVYKKKLDFLGSYMSGEWDSLLSLLKQSQVLTGTAYTNERLRQALGILLCSFTVYRLYPDSLPLDEKSLRLVNLAFNYALLRESSFSVELDMLKSIFERHNDNMDSKRLHYIRRLMQFSGTLTAKGVEDTVLYIYDPLISHNEVGDQPLQLSVTTDAFHEKMARRQRLTPYSLNATSTHDTKRGEDARMRINVLTEMPEEWITHIHDWHMINAPYRTTIEGREVPSFNEEYFMYQSLIGSFPISEKVDDYYLRRTRNLVLKFLREAKEHTTYEISNRDYENACLSFIENVLHNDVFLRSFSRILQKILIAAKLYGVAQAILKITAPGIADIYQGAELWDTNYVDPDNRNNINYKIRERLISVITERQAQPGFLHWLTENDDSGAQKIYAISCVAHYRRKNPELFLQGTYLPLNIQNGKEDGVAFARVWTDKWIITVLPLNILLHYKENENPVFFWEKLWMELPLDAPSHWRNIFTGAEIIATHSVLNLGEIFALFPVAVLEGS